ncbi:hypothetical protein BDQ17DRAFT_644752 [Cyathus striatus]|nr:hypothetical protein BDQ17DRAFT_644752 [Cyathus striatus]
MYIFPVGTWTIHRHDSYSLNLRSNLSISSKRFPHQCSRLPSASLHIVPTLLPNPTSVMYSIVAPCPSAIQVYYLAPFPSPSFALSTTDHAPKQLSFMTCSYHFFSAAVISITSLILMNDIFINARYPTAHSCSGAENLIACWILWSYVEKRDIMMVDDTDGEWEGEVFGRALDENYS